MKDTPGLTRLKLAVSSSKPRRCRIGITAGTSDSPTSSSGRRPSSKSVTSPPWRASRIARADPAGPARQLRPADALAARCWYSWCPGPSHLVANHLDDQRRLGVAHDALDPRYDEVVPALAAVKEYPDPRPGRNNGDVI